jgi:hypothetical protein
VSCGEKRIGLEKNMFNDAANAEYLGRSRSQVEIARPEAVTACDRRWREPRLTCQKKEFVSGCSSKTMGQIILGGVLIEFCDVCMSNQTGTRTKGNKCCDDEGLLRLGAAAHPFRDADHFKSSSLSCMSCVVI